MERLHVGAACKGSRAMSALEELEAQIKDLEGWSAQNGFKSPYTRALKMKETLEKLKEELKK